MSLGGTMQVTGRPSTWGRKQSEKCSITAKQVDTPCDCSICQEPVGASNAEGRCETWSMLPCGHRFGSYCIKHYLNVAAYDHPSCPICRQPVSHVCGHPVLPSLITSHKQAPESIVHESKLLIARMAYKNCKYCKSRRKDRLAAGVLGVSPLRRAVTWVKTTYMQKQRQRRAMEDVHGDVWAGGYLDVFPRRRDADWEKWWLKQEPKGA